MDGNDGEIIEQKPQGKALHLLKILEHTSLRKVIIQCTHVVTLKSKNIMTCYLILKSKNIVVRMDFLHTDVVFNTQSPKATLSSRVGLPNHVNFTGTT